MDEKTASGKMVKGSRFWLYSGSAIFAVTLASLTLWVSRTALADNIVQSELAKRDITASFEVADIGLNRQVIRNVVIGDPAHPDLTADLVEVGNSLTLGGVGINWVRAKGVRLYGQVIDGRVSFGELDKFTDPNDKSPLALPDIWVGLSDARLRIDSDFGPIGLALNGEGELQDGFKGELAAASRKLSFADCATENLSYFGEVTIKDKQPHLKGPLRLPGLNCPKLALTGKNIAAQLNVKLGAAFADAEGEIGLIGEALAYQGYAGQKIASTIKFTADTKQSKGDIELTSGGLRSPYGNAGNGGLTGAFSLAYGDADWAASFDGSPSLGKLRLAGNMMQSLRSLAATTGDTPVAPLAEKFAAALQRAGQQLDISSKLSLKTDAKRSTLAIDDFRVRSASGAKLTLSDPLLVSRTDNNLRLLADGNVSLSGGGMPDARLVLNDGSLARGFSGRLEMATYRAGTAELKIPQLTFAATKNGNTNIDGRLILSGPLPDGQISGLQLPIDGIVDGKGRYAIFPQCVTLQFASLKSSSLSLGPTQGRFCPPGKAIIADNGSGLQIAANLPALKLNGAVGEAPLVVSSGKMDFSSAKGFTARDISVRLGAGEDITKLDLAQLSGFFGKTITGKLAGASGKIINVPLLMEEIDGDWQFSDGKLQIDANMLVRDAEPVERFRPLISNDVQLSYAGGEITASGLMLEPKKQVPVAQVNVVHSLNRNRGNAAFEIASLSFNDKMQPEDLTPLTLGIVANVKGEVSGSGNIAWDTAQDGVQSTGKFKTNGLDLAAAFGPVSGLSGEIEFSDLLAMETKPGQVIKLAEVNPGVAVYDGRVQFRLLPDRKLQIEDGKWPFAGGTLKLEPTTLDLSDRAERRFQFTVSALDAAQFLSKFEFENLNATGIFDGKLPMIFDQDGGRIEGGYLVAQPGGGKVAYVGELTYQDVGAMANFAFNALRSIKYRSLTIGLNGAIDGDMVTDVKFTGLQQGDDVKMNIITKQLAKIPIQFDVRISGPFMQLLSSVRSYYEPELLVGQNLPALLQVQQARKREAEKQQQAQPQIIEKVE